MVKTIRNVVSYVLKVIASLYLKMNKIKIIAVTGSAGKTTAKVALGQFLAEKDVYVPKENYNTEIGVPLVILGEKAPEKIVSLGWAPVIARSFLKIFKKANYKWMVLEISADHPGDIKYLTSFIKPTIAIVTTVLPVHLEEFKTIGSVAKEKGLLVSALKKAGVAILNVDDENVQKMRGLTAAGVFWIGAGEKADLRWENLQFSPKGLEFDLVWRGERHPVKTKFIAPQLLPSVFSAIAAGLYLKEDIHFLIKKLEDFKPEKGRMNLISGIKGSTIIDDSYNANPASVLAALDVLDKMPGRKIAALGSMRELGSIEKKSHEEVGKRASQVADIIITVGEVANHYLAGSAEKLNKKIVQRFRTSREAGDWLRGQIEKGDVALVKGSQNTIFMEELVKLIMAKPEDAQAELVRQSKMWEDKKAKL